MKHCSMSDNKITPIVIIIKEMIEWLWTWKKSIVSSEILQGLALLKQLWINKNKQSFLEKMECAGTCENLNIEYAYSPFLT